MNLIFIFLTKKNELDLWTIHLYLAFEGRKMGGLVEVARTSIVIGTAFGEGPLGLGLEYVIYTCPNAA